MTLRADNTNPVAKANDSNGANKATANLDSLFRLVETNEKSSSTGKDLNSRSDRDSDSFGGTLVTGGFKSNPRFVEVDALKQEAWAQYAGGDTLLSAELSISAAYKEREELYQLQRIRIESEAWLRNNPDEAKKIGKFGIPDGLVSHLKSTMGVDLDSMYKALDKDMTMDQINKHIEKTIRLEANGKQRQKTALDRYAWIIQSARESLKLSSSNQ